jgi:hypothetical protein
LNPRPLGYEPTDVRLRCLGQSPVTALTSADLLREVVPALLHLARLSLSRCVRFTNRFTEPVLDLWFSELRQARTCALRPVGSSRHRRPPERGAGQNRRFWVVNPNRISSSGRGCPDRFKLDQLRRPDFPGRRGTAVNCNPNCNRGLSAWGVPWLVLAVLTLQQLGQLLAGRRQVRAWARGPVIFVGPG